MKLFEHPDFEQSILRAAEHLLEPRCREPVLALAPCRQARKWVGWEHE
jgi:hypothetical protein